MGFVITPFAIKDVTIDVIENALTMRFVVAPFSFVTRTVWPRLLTEAMAEAAKPLALIDSAVFKCVLAFFMCQLFSLFFIVVFRAFLMFLEMLAIGVHFELPKMVLGVAQRI